MNLDLTANIRSPHLSRQNGVAICRPKKQNFAIKPLRREDARKMHIIPADIQEILEVLLLKQGQDVALATQYLKRVTHRIVSQSGSIVTQRFDQTKQNIF